MTSSRFPYLPIRLQIRESVYEVIALIDTGFDGGIAVLPTLFEEEGSPDGYELWTPMVGPSVNAPVYRGLFQVGDIGPYPVLVTALGDEVLVGLEGISRFSVTFDHGRQVIVGP